MDLFGNFLRQMADNIDPPKGPAGTAPSTAAPDTPYTTACKAAAKVSNAMLALEAWRRKYPEAAAELDAKADALNDAIEEAKPLVAAFPGETIGPFNVSKCAVKKGYDAALLPQHVRDRKGVLVLSVDTKVVDALVKCKEVDEADVAPARTETIGSASVRGPKPLVVQP